jgi:hypothetical protein
VQGLKSRDLFLGEVSADKAQSAGGAKPPGNYAVSKDPGADAISILIKLIHR